LGVGVTKSSKTVQILVCCVYKGIPCNNMNKRKLRFLKLVVVIALDRKEKYPEDVID